MHPKEAFISHGILNPEIARMKDAASLSRRGGHGGKPGSGGGSGGGARAGSASSNRSGGSVSGITAIGDDAAAAAGASGEGARGGLTFVYPYGATMTVQSPAHPVLSSGPISYPLNRPVAGVWERPAEPHPGGKGGRSDGGAGRRGSGGGSGSRAPRPEDHESGSCSCSTKLRCSTCRVVCCWFFFPHIGWESSLDNKSLALHVFCCGKVSASNDSCLRAPPFFLDVHDARLGPDSKRPEHDLPQQ